MSYLGLEGRRILVTGASSGIGRATAIEASRNGAILALSGRRDDALAETLAKLEGTGHVTHPYDLSDLDGIPDLVQRVADDLGGIDGIVHAAGIHSARPLRTIDAAHLDDVLRTNVSTAILIAKGFRSKRVARVDGSLVLLSSAVATRGQTGVAAYAASKGAISAVTKSLASELLRDRIRVNCVEPGIVNTPLTTTLAASVGEAGWAAIEADHPMGIGEPTDVAHAILYLLSSASRWVTGISLPVDGGMSAR